MFSYVVLKWHQELASTNQTGSATFVESISQEEKTSTHYNRIQSYVRHTRHILEWLLRILTRNGHHMYPASCAREL